MAISSDFLMKIFQLELKEVEHDLNGLKDLYSNRRDSSEITNYVFLENTALLQAELKSIHHISTLLDDISIDNEQTPHELLNTIDLFIQNEIAQMQYSEAIYSFVKSKLVKVSKYLDM